jgi:hypothetical protein
LRFIKRNVKTNSIKTKELAYKTYVRPKVEYCSVVWDPWQKQQINQIEMIQRRAARILEDDRFLISGYVDDFIFVSYMPTLPIYAVVYRFVKSSTAYRF